MAGYNSKFTGQQVDSLLEEAGSFYQKPETGIPQSDLDESTQQILQNVGDKVNKEEGKVLSTNDFTDEYKAKVEDSASQEGYFPKMSVGIAANLAGRGEATEQVFTYRPTDGGTSIESGVAKIRRVKGNSVVWNQMLGESSLTSNGVTSTFNNGVITLSGTPTTTWFNVARGVPVVLGHKMLLQLFVVANQNNIDVIFGDLNDRALVSSLTGGGTIYEVSGQSTHYLAFNDSNLTNIDFTGYQMRLMHTDLTAMFGAGNEPTTVEEFRTLYPDSYYPYNTGELRNLDCSGIKTVGFNQWDEQWEYGYFTQDGKEGTNTTHIKCRNYIPVISGATYYAKLPEYVTDFNLFAYDENFNYIAHIHPWVNTTFTIPQNAKYCRFYVNTGGNPYNNDICINLHHTGWRDGDYEPYKEVTHSLPLSQITDGEPLRKAGSVYDEINETHYIKRVGVRPYTEGDKNDATLLTDGTNTNYPLAEPIVTPIETVLNLDYQAEDFGTEEALLTDNSAPFSADIVYQFNAVDRIRENTLDIEDLLARVIALENAVATTTSIPDIPDITE